MRRDFVGLSGVAFRFFSDTQKQFFTRAPYRFGETIVLILAEKDSRDTSLPCARIIGDLLIENDEFCSHIVKSHEFLLLRTLQHLLATGGEK